MALTSGSKLGPYEILAPLGAGGMGEVYRARDPRLDREVAVKVLREEVADDFELLKRFHQEAKAAGALNHPNILAVHDIGMHEGLPYVVTELLEGQTLRKRMGGAALPVRKAVEYGVQISRGLAAAHEKGIVHRDLKPENLFVTKHGLVKILDFGLAKVVQPGLPVREDEDTPSRGLTTEPGRIMGTVGYMSPEQVRGQTVDHLSDLFSFGTVLYEMLSGHRPFRGETPADTMTAILTKDPQEPSATDRSIPKALDRIVFRCLEKQSEDRFQSARDLAFGLEAVSVATGARRGIHRWTLAGAVVVAALALTVAYLRPWPEARPSFAAQPALSESTRDRKMLVVLPFDNLGPPEDAYFAAGMTEEITSRLARVSGLGVISRTSAVQYDRAGKTIKQIGSDLGVGYVLEGTVRWARQTEGQGRVRITPQLIAVADDTHLWADSYDRVIDDIFTVQSEIAGAVVGQLGVALLPDEQRAIAARPTESLEAYQAYLRGLEYYWDPDYAHESYELAVRMFERAVGYDPAFVAAHGFLSEAHSALYWFWYDRSPERLDAAREAALRALELDPDSPEGHRALGSYHYHGHRDYQQALEEYRLAAKRLPNDCWIAARIGWVRRRQGLHDGAIAGLKKALELDPRNAYFASELAGTYRFVRQYPEADRYYDLSISLAPNQGSAYGQQALVALSWNGALERARAAVAGARESHQPDYFGARVTLELYERTYQAALDQLAAGPAIIGETGAELHPRELLEGDAYRLMGRADEARAAYQATRAELEKLLKERPEDHRLRSSLSRAYAGLGRKAEAIREAQRAVSLLPVSRDARDGVLPVWTLAVVYTMVGEHDEAIDQLEYLLSIPSWWSAWDLRLDPRWDPLRDHPRFKKLVGENWQAETSTQ